MDKKFVTIRLSGTKSVYAVKISDSPCEKYIDIDKISRRMLVTSAIDGRGNPVRVWYTRAQLAVS